MSTHTNCLICNSSKLNPLEVYSKAHLVKCENCKFVFSKQIPTEQELINHYEGYGRNDYLSPLTIKRYNELLDEFEKYRKTNKIIDVGCGIGYFLEEAKKRGWEVYGTEYTDEAVEICSKKGISISKGKLDPLNYPSEIFDIITSFEVIEHINNPIEEVTIFNQLLRPGGMAYLTTPNFNSLLRYRLKAAWNIICYPEHLGYYKPKTIKRLFVSQGFQALKIQTTGISLTRLRTSKGTSNQQLISATSDDEKVRRQFESKWHLKMMKKVINGTLTLFGKGDSLKVRFLK
jgi:2-polyprenyl-3-methyl-5-hydroxy-6-metoxy-1,4-benzoquinol methylase